MLNEIFIKANIEIKSILNENLEIVFDSVS